MTMEKEFVEKFVEVDVEINPVMEYGLCIQFSFFSFFKLG